MSGNKVSPANGDGSLTLQEGVGLQNEDAILDHYMKLPWYTQTKHSAATAIKSVWKKQCEVNGTERTKENLKSYWTTTGVVSALILGVSYSSATSPLETTDPDAEIAVSLAAVFTGISLMLSLAVIVIATIYMIEIDNCTTERDLRDFINANASIFDVLTGVFSASLVLLVGAALSSMYVTYGRTEFIIVACVTGAFILLGAVFAAVLAGHNRFRIWARYDSPLAKERGMHMRKLQQQQSLEQPQQQGQEGALQQQQQQPEKPRAHPVLGTR